MQVLQMRLGTQYNLYSFVVYTTCLEQVQHVQVRGGTEYHTSFIQPVQMRDRTQCNKCFEGFQLVEIIG